MKRYLVLFALFVLSLITYIDRACISSAKGPLSADLSLTDQQMGAVSGAMNMIGNFGSFVSANAFPWLLGLTGSANTYFIVAALLNLVAVACWLRMRPPTRCE